MAMIGVRIAALGLALAVFVLGLRLGPFLLGWRANRHPGTSLGGRPRAAIPKPRPLTITKSRAKPNLPYLGLAFVCR